jgi:hypothetical protein
MSVRSLREGQKRRKRRRLAGREGRGGKQLTLVRHDNNTVLLHHSSNVTNVRLAPVRSAGVGGVVEHDEGGVLVDEGLKVRDVDLPVLLGEEIVVADLAFGEGGHGLVGGEEGLGEEDVLTLAGEDVDALSRGRVSFVFFREEK